MQKQQVLIDNRYFIFECLMIGKEKNPEFTYKTNEKKVPKIVENYFEILKILGNVENFQKEIQYDHHWHHHLVEKPTQLELIRQIFQATKKDEKWIDQYIIDGIIYQIKFLNNSSCRLFFHKKIIGDFIIIQPLFLDINHLIYQDKKYEQIYNSCLVCHGKKCSKK